MASHAILETLGSDVSTQRAESVPLALELARLGVAAQFLTALRQANHETDIDLLQPFAIARQGLQQVHQAVAEHRTEEATRSLESLRTQTAQLRNLVAEVDAAAAVDATEAFVATRSSTVDQLRRMIEYHALISPHTAESRRKLVLLALAIIRREPMDAPQPRTVRNALQRLKVMDRSEESLDAELIHEAATLRRRVQAMTPRHIPQLRADVDGFTARVGEALYSLGGLCQVVALRLMLADRLTTLEREGARSFDEYLDELDGVVCDGEVALAPIVSAPSDNLFEEPAAIEILASIESDLNQASADGDFTGRGIYLEEVEVEAFTQPGTEAEWKSLLARGAVCRTAMDRMARKHSRSGQDDGVEPTPVPRPIALCLIRRALRVERELEDINQNSVVRGDITTAKMATRCVHRIARTRLGLALLADIPPDGRIGPTLEATNPEPAKRNRPDSGELEAKLEQAKLFRDALLRDKAATEAIAGVTPAAPNPTSPLPASAGSTPSRNPTLVMRRAPKPVVKKSLRILLAVVTLATVGFHGARLFGGGEERSHEVRSADFSASAQIERIVKIEETLVAKVDSDWLNLASPERMSRVRVLWAEARARGHKRLVVVGGTNGRPVAIADDANVTLLEDNPEPQVRTGGSPAKG